MRNDVAAVLMFGAGGLLIILFMVGLWHWVDARRGKKGATGEGSTIGGAVGHGEHRGNGERETGLDPGPSQKVGPKAARQTDTAR
jgi:hypothetical protein